MANLKIPTQVTGPDKIEVPLVRADHMETGGIFRTLFEIFLSIFSTLLGTILSSSMIELIHWCFLFVSGCAAVTFLSLTIYFNRKAHKK